MKWTDAFGEASWTDERALDKLLKEHSKPENQTLYFLKQTDEFYIFASGKPMLGNDYLDIHGILKGWIQSMRLIK